MSFSEDYWKKNYSEPESMDGIVNAKEHANYISSLFRLHEVQIKSMIDLGFGLGHLMREFSQKLNVQKVVGIEPSEFAFNKVKKKAFIEKKSIKIYQDDIINWLEKDSRKYDLGICNSVLQYISDEEIPLVLQKLSEKVRYIYFTVPTDKELNLQEKEHSFIDEYALKRSVEFYRTQIQPHFSIVSSRLLESRHFFNDDNTVFNDLFYRI
jgi:trans-aconitate methyltransferase